MHNVNDLAGQTPKNAILTYLKTISYEAGFCTGGALAENLWIKLQMLSYLYQLRTRGVFEAARCRLGIRLTHAECFMRFFMRLSKRAL